MYFEYHKSEIGAERSVCKLNFLAMSFISEAVVS